MTIFSIQTEFAGQASVRPRRGVMVCDNTFAQITAAGFLNGVLNNGGTPMQTGDFLFVNYGANSQSQGIFRISITNNVATLSVEAEGITLPVVAGDIAVFADTSGTLTDTPNTLTDNSQFVGINEILISSVGTWTRTRIAEGNYVLRHTAANDTSVIGVDITHAIRTTAAKGFQLASIDVIYSVGTAALDAHTMVLDKISYANNVAVSITSVPLTGSLAIATQANPYVTNLAVTTPAFLVTADSKYVAELTVNAAATSAYDFYGLNLNFTQTVA